MNRVADAGRPIAELPLRLAGVGVAAFPQQAYGAGGKALGKVRVEPAQVRARHFRKGEHQGRRKPPPRPRNARDLLIQAHNLRDGLVFAAEDVFFAGAAPAHAQQMSFDNVARRNELETAIDIGAELAIGVVAQGSSQPRGEEISASHHSTTCCDHDILSRRRCAPAFLLDQRLAALIGHGAFHGIERHRLVAGRGRLVQIVADRAEGAGHDHAAGLYFPRRLQHVVGAADIALEQLPAMAAVAFDGRDLGCNMIDALTAGERLPGGIQIPDITEHALHIEAFQRLIVVLAPQQHPDRHAVAEQPAHEIGADMPGRTGNENRRHRRAFRHARSGRHRGRFPLKGTGTSLVP